MLKAVIFDMDGVIVNSEAVYHRCEIKIAELNGLPLTISDFSQYEGIYLSTMWQELKEKYTLDINVSSIIEQEEAMMREYYSNGYLDVISETVDLIRFLHSKGVLCAIATSSITESALAVISRLDLSKYIETMVSGSLVLKCKPFPDIFLKCLETIHAIPDECVVVEDSMSGCIAAKTAKLKVIGYRNPFSRKQDLSHADVIVDNIGEIDLKMLHRLT